MVATGVGPTAIEDVAATEVVDAAAAVDAAAMSSPLLATRLQLLAAGNWPHTAGTPH